MRLPVSPLGRQCYWANYVTSLGAALHELGHAFDLAHTATGVMARGFDDIDKFCLVSRRPGGQVAAMHPMPSSATESVNRDNSAIFYTTTGPTDPVADRSTGVGGREGSEKEDHQPVSYECLVIYCWILYFLCRLRRLHSCLF